VRLAIDQGNTRVKLGVFDGSTLVKTYVYKQCATRTLKQIIHRHQIRQVAICASGNLEDGWKEVLESSTEIVRHLDHTIKLPIDISYTTPHTLGKDRIAAAIGAYRLQVGTHYLIINMGTCITMDVLTQVGKYLGGNISPGLKMRVQAMHKFTARLPQVDVEVPEVLIGFNTVSALQNGGVKGALREIESFIEEISAQYAPLTIIVSGGDAPHLVSYSKYQIFARPNIVLEGLNEILS
jgi:type III pantothenate kinase